eukprot:6361253-Prymnesium_polylepis.1
MRVPLGCSAFWDSGEMGSIRSLKRAKTAVLWDSGEILGSVPSLERAKTAGSSCLVVASLAARAKYGRSEVRG